MNGSSLDALVREVEAAPFLDVDPNPDVLTGITNANLCGGYAGMALALLELNGDTASVQAALDRTAESVARFPFDLSLFNGLAGIGCVFERCRLAGFEPWLDQLDALMLQFLEQQTRDTLLRCDVFDGLAGYAIYCLDRLPRANAQAALELIVTRLAERAVGDDEAAAFFTSPELLPVQMQADAPEGWYELGMAHGQGGILAALVAIDRAGVSRPLTRNLIERLSTWLVRHARDGRKSAFPLALRPDGSATRTRFAWCRGDLGIALALLRAARELARLDWEQTARAILERSARRTVEDAETVDVTLCHGTLGLCRMFRRAHMLCGDRVLADAADYWLESTNAFRGFETETGFRFSKRPNRETRLLDAGFLMGAAGAALAIAAELGADASWERLLLIHHD